MNNPLISVIIPVYNVEEYLRQCLDSVIDQSYRNLEIICVDDCSTDNSLNILKEYEKKDSRIKVLQNEKNIGVGLTRNNGFEVATGEYIHYFDPDDWLEIGAYERVIKKLNVLEFLPDVVYFLYDCYFNDKKTCEEINFHNTEIVGKILHPVENPIAFENWDRYAWAKFHNRKFLKTKGIYYTSARCIEEIEQAALVYTKAESIYYVDEKVLNYRVGRKNSLVSQIDKNIKGIIQSYDNVKKIYKDLPEDLKYKMLGFDYWTVRRCIEYAFKQGVLSWWQLFLFVLKMNTKDFDKYNYIHLPKEEYCLKLKFWKTFFNKYNRDFYLKIKDFKLFK